LTRQEHPEPTQRLFFALWPTPGLRQALARESARAARSSGGRAVPAENLHVTLAFLGSVPRPRVPELRHIAQHAAAACARAVPLALRFERLEFWPRQQILCALGAEDTPAAGALAAVLKDAAAAAGFTPDLKPFRAHVTVARKATHAPPGHALREIVWRFDGFALIDSRTEPSGPVYSVVDSYSLVKSENPHE
jgi:RNA 2',3'-cyclic 3'-phosphodiesterase